MGKNTRRQIQYRDEFHGIDVSCDSVEECDFIDWCSEATELGILKDFQYQPDSILLSDGVKYRDIQNKSRTLFREHVYSPDFMLEFDPKASIVLSKEMKVPFEATKQDSYRAYIDVKGGFQRGGSGRAFSINQKWTYQKTGIIVLKIVPKDFFKKCGCPKRCFFTRKTSKARTAFKGYKTLAEALSIDT